METEDKNVTPEHAEQQDDLHKAGRKKARGKGMGTLLLRGKVYQARIVVNNRIYTKSTKTGIKKEAEAFLKNFVADFQTKEEAKLYDNLAHRAMTFQQQVEDAELKKPALSIKATWTAFKNAQNRPDSGERTLHDYELQFYKFQDWVVKHHSDIVELRAVTQEIADEFATFLAENYSANRFNKYVTLFRSMWNVLKGTAKLTINPWKNIHKKQQPSHRKRELTAEELIRIFAAATGELKTLFALGIYTGLRLGDCATMDWGSVDLLRRIITVTPHKTARRTNGKTIPLPIADGLFRQLVSLPTEHKGFVLPELALLYKHNSALLTRKIQSHFIACGIATSIKSEADKRAKVNVGFHSFRHTFISICANAGVPLAIVQKIVGHSNALMTEYYVHEDLIAFQKATALIPDVISTDKAPALPAPVQPSKLDTFKTLVQTMTDAELQEARSFLASLN